MSRIVKALRSADETKSVAIGTKAIDDTAKIFGEMFPGKPVIVVADSTTYKIAGERVHNLLAGAGIKCDTPCIFDAGKVYASWEWIERLDEILSRTEAIPVAVGSGTINDLTKLSAHRTGRRYITVATAPSMDGYTAFGASITHQGAKQTFSCPAPLAVIADTGIIAGAPVQICVSGYADLFAKIPAGADWIVADALGLEPMDDLSFGIVQGNLKSTLSDTGGIVRGDMTAIQNLTEGLLLGGFAMQAHKSSRPASGADHQFSHLWDMEHHTLENGTAPSHGFKVSIGLLASTALYEQFLNTDIGNLDIDACVGAWHDRTEMERKAREMFRGTDFPEIGITEYGSKYCGAEELRGQLIKLRSCWPGLSKKLRDQLLPFDKAVGMLASVGAPTLPKDIGISRRRLRDSYRRALYIRRRFTILDVADRCGMMDKWLDNIFAPGTIWEM